ncbi:hypothetical protein PspLS_10253 [Pyricularia sp. CBS 133598]|nr:hypothetical protein PspLS_10253 [Pyricularia sp. CBS 133598]
MSYRYAEPTGRTKYTESGWQHQYTLVTEIYTQSPSKHSQPAYQPVRKGSMSSRRGSSGNYERQPVCREPSSRQYPPTSKNKIFDKEYFEHYSAAPPPRPRSSSQSQPVYPADIFPPLQRSSSTRTRRDSHSSSQRPTGERSRRASGVSSESRHNSFGRHDTLKDQYRNVDVVGDDGYDSKAQYGRSQRHESAVPREDGRLHRTSSRRSSRTGDSKPQRGSEEAMLLAESERLQSANVKTSGVAEAAWYREEWREASMLYGQLESDLRRLSHINRQLGRYQHIYENLRQANEAADGRIRALEKSWISSHRGQYDGYIADAEAFENGPGKNLAKANQSYASAIMMLFELRNTSPERLHAHYPGCIEYLEHKQRKVQGRIDKQTSEEDRDAANAVRKFIGEFHLVEKLIEQGEGPETHHQFDRAKKTFVETLVTLPKRFLPSEEWINKMNGAINDQARRAKEKFGEDCVSNIGEQQRLDLTESFDDSPVLTSISSVSPSIDPMDLAAPAMPDDNVPFGDSAVFPDTITGPLFPSPQLARAQNPPPINHHAASRSELNSSTRRGTKRKSTGSSSTYSASPSPRSSASPPPRPTPHLPPKKTAHNMIEKRYRNNLNDKISALRDAVPALRVMVHRLEAHASPDESSNSRCALSPQEFEEDLGGLTPAHKLNKATILSKATEYINHLERKNRALARENHGLRGKVDGLEMLVMNGAAGVQRVKQQQQRQWC